MPRLTSLVYAFAGIGAFTIGGGYAMLPLIEKEVVKKRQWLDGPGFVDALAIAQAFPGPVAFNAAVFIGYHKRGVAGAFAAAFGVVLPSFAIMLAAVAALAAWRDNPAVVRVFAGLRPAVTALIVAAVPTLAKNAGLGRRGYLLAALVAVVLVQPWLPVSPVWMIVSAFAIAVFRFIMDC